MVREEATSGRAGRGGVMWHWDNDRFPSIDLGSEPALAAIIAGLGTDRLMPTTVNDRIAAPLWMRTLPLVEWDMSLDAPGLFHFLSARGSTHGFFVDGPWVTGQGDIAARRCELDEPMATLVRREQLLAETAIFVDAQFLVAIVPEFSDFCWLGMQRPLFDDWLAQHPIALDLHDEGGPRSAAFHDALTASFRRLDDWQSMTGNDMRRQKEALSWQLRGRR